MWFRAILVLSMLGWGIVAADFAEFDGEKDLRGQWPDRTKYTRGRYVFQKHCVVCHGPFGRGDGEMTPGMLPKPRDLTRGIFKFRSTPSGYLPTTQDLRRTVLQGLSGSAMPSFTMLPERDLEAVVEYIKSFSLRWRQPANYATPLDIPDEPPWMNDRKLSVAHVQAGEATYAKACAACHGSDGRGGMPKPGFIEDSDGVNRFPPPDLTQRLLRGGPRRRDVYRTLITGIDGTPMPSFRETLTDEQLWELVAFLESLRKEA